MNNNVSNNELELKEELPWLVFKLHNLAYTINSRIVNGILQYPETITPVASAPEVFRGIMNSRGGIIPLLDMRALFSLKSTQEDFNEFIGLVNDMKSETDGLFSSITSSLSSSDIVDFAHQTAIISKWKFQAMRQKNNGSTTYKELPLSLIEHIDEYARYSGDVLNLIKNNKNTEEEMINSSAYKGFKKVRDELHEILTDSLEVYQEKYKEIIVTVSDGVSLLGLIVDEVVAVEFLEILSDEEHFPKFQRSKFFCGVARSGRVKGEILIINEEMLLELSNQFEGSK